MWSLLLLLTPLLQGAGTAPRTHWAYTAPREIAPPSATAHPIDAFLDAAHAREGLRASEPVERATLLRRVAIDLIGLPPTPEELDAFVADTRPDACERVVDRLLASPHYGERQAMHWLDLARFADTNPASAGCEGPRRAIE